MKKVRFKSLAKVITLTENYNQIEVVDLDIVKQFDGIIHYDEEFTDYFSGENDEILEKAGVTGGILSLHFDEKTQRLFTYVEYDLQRDLTKDELDLLLDYTDGHLSDGVGSSFSQCFPCGTTVENNCPIDKKYFPIVYDFYSDDDNEYIIEFLEEENK